MDSEKKEHPSGLLRARDEIPEEEQEVEEEEEEELGQPDGQEDEEEEDNNEGGNGNGGWDGVMGEMETRVYFGVRGRVVCCDLGEIPGPAAAAAAVGRDEGVPVVWEARVGRADAGDADVHVVCAGERVFCGCGRTVSCLAAATGAVLWSCAVPVQAGAAAAGESEVSLVVDAAGGAVLATSCGAAVSVAQTDGRVRWAYWLPVPAAECEHATPRLCGRALVLAAERIVACVDADSGAERWCREAAAHEQFMPSVAWDGGARLVLCSSGYLRRLDHATGAPCGPPVALAGLTPAAAVFDALRRRFVVAAAGNVWCLADDAANTLLWRRTLPRALTLRFSSLALEEGSGTVYLATGDRVVALAPNGDDRWCARLPTPFMVLATVLCDETGTGTLLVCGRGRAFVLDAATGRTLARRTLARGSLASLLWAPVAAATAHHAMDPSASCCVINPLAFLSLRENAAVLSSYLSPS